MSRKTTQLGITVVAAAGLFGAMQAASPIALADAGVPASPGVPCLDMITQLAAAPPDAGAVLQSAATGLVGSALPPAAPIPAGIGPVGAVPPVPAAPAVPPMPALPLGSGPLPGLAAPAAPLNTTAGAVPPAAAPIVPAAGALPPAVPAAAVTDAAGLVPPVAPAAAPITDAAGVVPPLAPAAVPDIPALASLAPSQVGLPTVPGLPVALPSALSLPHDLVCADTAW